MATKLYRNNSKEIINVLGIGEIEPGGQVSITGQYLPVVILENYPGLLDATNETSSASNISDIPDPKIETKEV